MLSYGCVSGQFSRITSHTYIKNLSKPLKAYDFVNINYLKYSNKGDKSKPGVTASVEECVPKANKIKNVTPLPTLSASNPLQGSSPPLYSETTQSKNHSRPLCEDKPCPPLPEFPPICEKNKCDDSGGKGFWQRCWATWYIWVPALLSAGLLSYVLFLQTDNKSKKRKKSFVFNKIKREKIQNPSSSCSIPKEVPYLVVGAGTAAFSAFRSIKANDPTAKVLMITNEGDLPYMRPPLSKEIWYNKDETLISKLIFKQWNGSKRSLYYEPPEYYMKVNDLEKSEKGGVAVVTGWDVKKIDATNRVAYLQDDYEIKYDKCLIATGASPKNLSLFDSMSEEIKEKIILFRTKDDFLELMYNVKKPDVKDILVIGGGFLGSELSTSLVRNLTSNNKNVYQVFKEKYILSQVLPEYLSKWATEHIEADGVKCVPNLEVHDCRMKNGRLSVMLTNGNVIEVDQIVVAIGVQANTALAKESNLEVDSEQGGFLVNAELEARSNLWVAGDAACFYDVKLGRRRIEHHDNAVISGKVAGENMVGAGKPYLYQSMLWCDLGQEIGFEAIGIIDSNLETVGVFAKAPKPETKLLPVAADENLKVNKKEVKNTNNVLVQRNEVYSDGQNVKEEHESAEDDYGKGVIFYLRNDTVVGIVLWNIFNRMSIARQVLARETKSDELNEVVKLFTIHED
ncbi:PREDICTED: apoptosis-inducing factor 1, mitochondrial [Ceratosolen solmsi marchali]|uniref:Apoptosis-inducing factor 1, mitochondrial n=1 Tax=Ceratosolen solmsi marchali TaxID=326594 RepID=A0AAJ6YI89_9HYME|nr:PREDICTED: apoptosis-inducing factor 1, mitochondrial [Ceratosolen solmsi marchali]